MFKFHSTRMCVHSRIAYRGSRFCHTERLNFIQFYIYKYIQKLFIKYIQAICVFYRIIWNNFKNSTDFDMQLCVKHQMMAIIFFMLTTFLQRKEDSELTSNKIYFPTHVNVNMCVYRAIYQTCCPVYNLFILSVNIQTLEKKTKQPFPLVLLSGMWQINTQ